MVWVLSNYPGNQVQDSDYSVEIGKVSASYAVRMVSADESQRKQLEDERQAAVTALILAQRSERAENSYMGKIGKALTPLFVPLGIDWRGSVALLCGFVAKEIVVSTMGVLYAVEGSETDALNKALRSSGMTRLSALSMMVFVLLYLPCLATIATIRRETESLRWMFFSIFYSTTLAWVAAFIVYQGGRLLDFA